MSENFIVIFLLGLPTILLGTLLGLIFGFFYTQQEWYTNHDINFTSQKAAYADARTRLDRLNCEIRISNKLDFSDCLK